MKNTYSLSSDFLTILFVWEMVPTFSTLQKNENRPFESENYTNIVWILKLKTILLLFSNRFSLITLTYFRKKEIANMTEEFSKMFSNFCFFPKKLLKHLKPNKIISTEHKLQLRVDIELLFRLVRVQRASKFRNIKFLKFNMSL